MGAVVHPHLTKQKNHYPASFAFLQLGTQFLQQALDINPLYVTANRRRKISSSVFWCLRFMSLSVPSNGTIP